MLYTETVSEFSSEFSPEAVDVSAHMPEFVGQEPVFRGSFATWEPQTLRKRNSLRHLTPVSQRATSVKPPLNFDINLDANNFTLTINLKEMLTCQSAGSLMQLQAASMPEDCRTLTINYQDQRCNLFTVSTLIALDDACRERDQRLVIIGNNADVLQAAVDDHRHQQLEALAH